MDSGRSTCFDFDRDDLHAEWGRVAVDDGLDADVELLAMGEKAVKIDLAEDRAKSGLGELRRLIDVVGDFDDSLGWVDDAKGDDRVDLEGDVIAGDDVLGGDFHGLLAERDAGECVRWVGIPGQGRGRRLPDEHGQDWKMTPRSYSFRMTIELRR